MAEREDEIEPDGRFVNTVMYIMGIITQVLSYVALKHSSWTVEQLETYVCGSSANERQASVPDNRLP